MNDNTKKILFSEAETQVSITVSCQQCSEEVEVKADTEEKAKKELIETIKSEKFYIGALDSDAYGSIFSCVCNGCLKDILAEEKLHEMEAEKKISEMT
jgi:hypothetical protein